MRKEDEKTQKEIEAKTEELSHLIENYKGEEPLDLVETILDLLLSAPINTYETLGILELVKKEYLEIIDSSNEDDGLDVVCKERRDEEKRMH